MPVPDAPPKLRRTLARDVAYSDLRDWILQGILVPGERLHDVELAQRLGVSRTPVREALQRLEDEGLVETSPNRWTRVAPLDPNDALNLYPIIWRLESLALELAIEHLDDAELDEMHRVNERLKEALHAGNAISASATDHEFHQIFVDRCANPALTAMLSDLKVKLRRIEIHYFGSLASLESVAEHAAVLSALEFGDFAGAAEAVEANWKNSQRRLLSDPGLGVVGD
jgi:DNA-binding GntR family transcriptional regulator